MAQTVLPATRPSHRRSAYRPAISPRLRRLFVLVLVLVAVIGANSLYLVCVTAMEGVTGRTYQNYFYTYMFLGHLVLGLALIVPFIAFGALHMRNTWRRKNRRAVRMGYALFTTSLVLLFTGLLLMRLEGFEIRSMSTRRVLYWLHVVTPLVCLWMYWLHRLAGPPIRWRVGLSYLATAAAATVLMIWLHNSDPRQWYQQGPDSGSEYFQPSLARTASGKFIDERVLMNDRYCAECHPDVHSGWAASAHRFSSFNNPAYLVSVRETRQVSMERDGNVRRSRWCAGCHDPVPFFSGRFDDPAFDDVRDTTAHAGITCTVCHAITNVNSVVGNGDYTIEEPMHYPFALSENRLLQWVNKQLVKAKPAFHKRTFLKPFHQEAEFCSVCHKVHLPKVLNDYRFLRGQNHYDSYLLSGVSGHGARSFYYPKHAESNCNGCHMPAVASNDFAARTLPGVDGPAVHDHLFPGGNTALPAWRDDLASVKAQQAILENAARVDIFGLHEPATIDGPLTGPLRPNVPPLEAGKSYLLDIVVRTLTLGHHLTQGTADSNELWVEVTLFDNGRPIAVSGDMDPSGRVDPWAYFVNVFMLDRNGFRINRRNAQDIFVPLYNHQIPPGAAQTIHYHLAVPADAVGPLEVQARLLYRKFDQEYIDIIRDRLRRSPRPPQMAGVLAKNPASMPVTVLGSDRIHFSVASNAAIPPTPASNGELSVPAWQRWNDYGIGLFLKGKAELRQAAAAFEQVERFGRYDGPLNLARVLFREGRLDEAAAAVRRAADYDQPPAPPWVVAYLSGLVNRQLGDLSGAETNFRTILRPPTQEMARLGFDFRRDYEVINLLGQTIYDQSRGIRATDSQRRASRTARLTEAAQWFQRTLGIDPENATAHYNLQLIYAQLGDRQRQQEHARLHLKYKVDDNARDRAVAAARRRYPAANQAAEAVAIYQLRATRIDVAPNRSTSTPSEQGPPATRSTQAAANASDVPPVQAKVLSP